jgi:hypothetical protein
MSMSISVVVEEVKAGEGEGERKPEDLASTFSLTLSSPSLSPIPPSRRNMPSLDSSTLLSSSSPTSPIPHNPLLSSHVIDAT